jgi:hypothetical protein
MYCCPCRKYIEKMIKQVPQGVIYFARLHPNGELQIYRELSIEGQGQCFEWVVQWGWQAGAVLLAGAGAVAVDINERKGTPGADVN